MIPEDLLLYVRTILRDHHDDDWSADTHDHGRTARQAGGSVRRQQRSRPADPGGHQRHTGRRGKARRCRLAWCLGLGCYQETLAAADG
jgi:hypothetical protein